MTIEEKKWEVIKEFRKRFIRGVGPGWAGTEPTDAEAWVEADIEELEGFIYQSLSQAITEATQAERERINPEYPNLLPIDKKTREWFKFHDKMGADIVFDRFEDEYGIVRENPIKAIYQSPYVKFKEVMALSSPEQDTNEK